MTQKNVHVYLNDVLESIKQIEEYTRGITEDDFFGDLKTQDSVMRRLEIIGEAVKNMPADFKESHPDIPWKKIGGMRNALIHEYAGVKIDRVWKVVEHDLSELKVKIEKIISEIQ